MQIAQAIEIIQEYQVQNALPFILEAVIDMQDNREDLNPQQLIALNVFVAMGQQMFAPA
jgi:hypothetical protein